MKKKGKCRLGWSVVSVVFFVDGSDHDGSVWSSSPWPWP
jgi:hypothetical protein